MEEAFSIELRETRETGNALQNFKLVLKNSALFFFF